MRDSFLELFGASTDDDDDEERPRPAPRSVSLATVVAVLGRHCVVDLPGAERALVEQTVFEFVEAGAVIPVFAESDGRWSMLDPRWELPDHPSESAALVRGADVAFDVASYDADRDALVGRVGEHAAFAPRARLPWPAPFRDSDLSRLAGRTLAMAVADPVSDPVEVGAQGAIKKLPDRLSLAQLYSLRTLAELKPDLKARVVATDGHFRVELFGKQYHVFPEDRGWYDSSLPAAGKMVDVHVSVDMAGADLLLCLRCPHHPEWADTKRRYPVGAIIERADFLSLTYRGMVVGVPDRTHKVVGIVPVFQLAPPGTWRHESLSSVPVPLRVVGHSDERCVLLLDVEPYVDARWSTAGVGPGSILPMNEWSWSVLDPVVLWDIGCRATTTRPLEGHYEWGEVIEWDAKARRLVLEPRGATRTGTVDTEATPKQVVFDDGSKALLSKRSASPANGATLGTTLAAVEFRSGAMAAVVAVVDQRWNALFDELERRFNARETVRGLIRSRVPSGLMVDIMPDSLLPSANPDRADDAALNAFLPASHWDVRPVRNLEPLIGQTHDFAIIKMSKKSRNVILSRRRLLEEANLGHEPVPDAPWDALFAELERRREARVTVRGRIRARVKGGLTVALLPDPQLPLPERAPAGEALTVFLPGSLIDTRQVRDLDRLIGETYDFVVIKLNRHNRNIVVSRRALLEEAQEVTRVRTMERLRVGGIETGVVKNIVPYGAFVDIGGIDGLVHVTDMANVRQGRVSEVLRERQTIHVTVLRISPDFKRISLKWEPPGQGLAEEATVPGQAPAAPATQGPGAAAEPRAQARGAEGTAAEAGARTDAPTDSGTRADPKLAATAAPELLHTRSGEVVSLCVLSARYSIRRPDLEQLYRSVAGGEVPEWRSPLGLDAARGVVRALPSANVPDRPQPSKVEPARAPSGAASGPGQASATGAGPASEPPPAAAPVQARPPQRAGGSGVQSTGLDALRRHLRARGAARSESEDEDEIVEDGAREDEAPEAPAAIPMLVPVTAQAGEPQSAGGPGGEDSAAPDTTVGDVETSPAEGELAQGWSRWLSDGSGRAELCDSLREAGLAAAAGLLDDTQPPGPIASESWALGELAEAAFGASRGDPLAFTPLLLERILRCLAARPDDVLPWTVLAQASPPKWLLQHVDDLDRWVRAHAVQRICGASMGRCLAVARAHEACGKLRSAHQVLGEWLRSGESADFRELRTYLAERHGRELLTTTRFFGRWSRRTDLEVGQGSFAVVLPVVDDETGETHALKHSRLLDSLGSGRGAVEALFDREAQMLRDLSGVGGVPRFVAQPGSEALVCQWVEGRTLAELLRESEGAPRRAARDVARLGRRLAQVLGDIDRRLPGFVHNDLAPRNVMIPGERSEDAVLLDLGLAAHTDWSVSSIIDELDLGLRTAYQAPEVKQGARATPQSDMYSLGLILLEAVTGKPAPAGAAAAWEAVGRLLYAQRDRAYAALGSVMQGLIRPTATERPANWDDVARRLSEVADG